MALKNILTVGSLLAAMIVGQHQTAEAQTYLPGARFEHRDIEEPDNTMPLATPGIFDYDAQLFAPVDFLSDDEMDPRIGFYLSFDKTYLSLSGAPRTNLVGAQFASGNNYTWGNRYNFGYFSESDKGWSASYQQNEGVSLPNGLDINLGPQTTVLDTTFASVELNRRFRQSSGPGITLEPYVGLRYFYVGDESIEDGGALSSRFRQKANNSAIGFQAGARHSRRAGRWRFTTDGAVVAAYNQQRNSVLDINVDATGAVSSLASAAEDQSFLPALDLEFDMAFNVTRDITLRTGVQFNYLWNGITRVNAATAVNNPNSFFENGGLAAVSDDDEDFIAAGFVFGFEWRR